MASLKLDKEPDFDVPEGTYFRIEQSLPSSKALFVDFYYAHRPVSDVPTTKTVFLFPILFPYYKWRCNKILNRIIKNGGKYHKVDPRLKYDSREDNKNG